MAASLPSNRRVAPIIDGVNLLRPADLVELATRAATDGWATARADYPRLRSAAERLGWKPVEIRRRDAGVTRLEPTPPEKAHRASHSARTGTGAQRLHTDGAHLRQPPRWIVLHAEMPNVTATKLVRLNQPLVSNHKAVSLPTAALGGLFLVTSGSERFLAALRTDQGGWRWDPGCMTACDQRARETVEFLSSLEERTEEAASSPPAPTSPRRSPTSRSATTGPQNPGSGPTTRAPTTSASKLANTMRTTQRPPPNRLPPLSCRTPHDHHHREPVKDFCGTALARPAWCT